jgi:hypothetical protein
MEPNGVDVDPKLRGARKQDLTRAKTETTRTSKAHVALVALSSEDRIRKLNIRKKLATTNSMGRIVATTIAIRTLSLLHGDQTQTFNGCKL